MPHSQKVHTSVDTGRAAISQYRMPMAVVATTLAWASAIAPGLALSQNTAEEAQSKQFAPKQFVEKFADVEQFLDVPSDNTSPSKDAVIPSSGDDRGE